MHDGYNHGGLFDADEVDLDFYTWYSYDFEDISISDFLDYYIDNDNLKNLEKVKIYLVK